MAFQLAYQVEKYSVTHLPNFRLDQFPVGSEERRASHKRRRGFRSGSTRCAVLIAWG
jgi:hypothetical protein